MNAVAPRIATAQDSVPDALLLTLDPVLTDRIGAALAGFAVLHRADPSLPAVEPLVAELRPALYLVDTQDAGVELGALVARLRRSSPTAAVVALGDEAAADHILTCMRNGAHDFVSRQIGEVALRRVLRGRFERGARELPADRQGPCTALAAGRHADPSRDVALAMAIRRAARAPGRVMLLDIGIGSREVEFALGTTPAYGVRDALGDLDRLDATLLKTAATPDPASGLSILLLGEDRRREEIMAGDLASLLAILRGVYDEVVVHAGAEPPPAILSPLLAMPRLGLVVTQTLGSAHGAAALLRTAATAGIAVADRFCLAVAEHEPRLHPQPNTIAGTLGLKEPVVLPDARPLLRGAGNEGTLARALVQDRPFTRRVDALSASLGLEQAARKAAPLGGLLGRLGLRR
jgi:Flp pilus assembly CpaE family ATPase